MHNEAHVNDPDGNTQRLSSFDQTEVELDRAIDELRGISQKGEDGDRDALGEIPDRRRKSDRLLLNIPVEVQIVIGTAEMTVAELMELADGSTVALDRKVGEPVDIVVNGVKIASGEITTMPGDPTRFGFRVLSTES